MWLLWNRCRISVKLVNIVFINKKILYKYVVLKSHFSWIRLTVHGSLNVNRKPIDYRLKLHILDQFLYLKTEPLTACCWCNFWQYWRFQPASDASSEHELFSLSYCKSESHFAIFGAKFGPQKLKLQTALATFLHRSLAFATPWNSFNLSNFKLLKPSLPEARNISL